MTDIWAFLLQTLSVSLVAALLMVVKWLLGDKLSPRWQYGVWSVLSLRIVLPVWTTGKYTLLPLPLWLETVKGVVENSLNSVYSSAYAPIRIRFPVPWVGGMPKSTTDWIFAMYAAGVLAVLLWYMVSYGRLRLLLRHGSSVSEKQQIQIDTVCEQYGLRPCRAVTVAGLPSAFVCGVVHPVLAIPAAMEIDDKVLLHELLHLRYFDAAQSVVWSAFRAIHWCNPFLQCVFNRIGNDMEQLCDQRVLERLEGEQRREYGGILLSMVNERYPRASGTTSLSNGGKNITRRIASIARFKKYPKGMELVSVCIAVVLLCASLFGTYTSGIEVGSGNRNDDWGFARAMASARLARCTTIAGALDTYAKGIMYSNGVYVAAASPLSKQEALAKEMVYNAKRDNGAYDYLQVGPESLNQTGYGIYNLKKLPDGGYEALLVFTANTLLTEDGKGCREDESGDLYTGVVAYPVKVSREDAWVVTENGEIQVYPISSGEYFDITQRGSSLLPFLGTYKAVGKSGTVTTQVQSIYTVDNTIENANQFAFWGSTSFDSTVKPDAEFASCTVNTESKYIFGGSAGERDALKSAGLQMVEMKNADSSPEFPDVQLYSNVSGSDNSGVSWSNKIISPDCWDGTVSCGSGTGWSGNMESSPAELPTGYAARIFWNGEPEETMILKEVVSSGTAAAG